MLEKEILWEEAGILWLGRRGEEEYGRRNFMEIFSVFTSPPLFDVRHGNQELGSVHESTFTLRQEGQPVLLLAGRSWRVTHLDWTRRIAQVEPASEERGARSLWRGEGQALSFELCQAILGVLSREDEPAAWSQRARTELREVRERFPWAKERTTTLLASPEGRVEWWTFAGGRANACLAAGLEQHAGLPTAFDNFAVRFKAPAQLTAVTSAIEDLRKVSSDKLRPRVDQQAIDGLKFSACLPSRVAYDLLEARLHDGQGVKASFAGPS